MAKYSKRYFIKDRNTGEPVGPEQVAESEVSWEDVADKIIQAHQNAAQEMYRVKSGAKLSVLMDADPDEPMYEFKERALTADELVRINGLLKDPKTASEGHKLLLEAQLGAPVAKIRQNLQIAEVLNRTNDMAWEIEKFKRGQPNYVESEYNRDKLIAYLTHKDRNWRINAKNLELAFEALSEKGELTIRASEPVSIPVAVPAVAELPPQPVAATTVPPVEAAIPPIPTPAAPISEAVVEQPATPVAQAVGQSSSGLTRDSGGTNHPPEPPKAKGITPAEISRMSSKDYLYKYEHDPLFKKQVDDLYKK